MACSDPHLPPGNAEVKRLPIVWAIALFWCSAVFYLDRLSMLRIPTIYGLPAYLGLALILGLCLARKGTSDVPVVWTVAGLGFIIGGAVFDMAATVVHSPALERETNPVARALLDSGHQIRFIYCYSIASQALVLASVSVIWISLLRHRKSIVDPLKGTNSIPALLKAATGGANLTWRQWLIPLKLSEMPSWYHLFWALVVMVVAGMSHRWYLALKWFRLVPSVPNWAVIAGAFCAGFVAYLCWLWYAVREGKTPQAGP